MVKLIRADEMPIWDYLLAHPAAELSAAEQEALMILFAINLPYLCANLTVAAKIL